VDRKSATMISMGFEIVGIIFAAVYIGGWIDKTYQWGGFGIIVAIAVGFTGWLIHVLSIVQMLEKEEEKSGNSDNKKP
jgi:F0F1-type ATP synthase assembly protein I